MSVSRWGKRLGGLVPFWAIAVASLTVSGCSFQSAPTVAPEAVPLLQPPIRRSLALVVTNDFANYVIQGSQDNREFHYDVGPGAVAALEHLLGQSFISFQERHVPSEAIALIGLGQPDTGAAATDLVALARFPSGGGTYVRPVAAGVEVRVELDVVSRDRKTTLSFLGVGRGSAGIYLGSAVAAAGDKALTEAITALADSLQHHRAELER